MSAAVFHPWEAPPAHGALTRVADCLYWARLPLPMALDHVNIYLADDGAGAWTLVDTGLDWPKGREALETVLSVLPGGGELTRILVTHHHPDHIGLAGMLKARGAELLMPRTGWLTARMLWLDEQPLPGPEALEYWRAAGMPPKMRDRKAEERPFNFRDMIAPLPLGFTALEDGSVLRLGQRDWRVRFGQGHAPDHAVLWEEGGDLVIAGDQMLPGISPNISVYPTEPEADPLGGWLATCTAFARLAREEQLVLCGHKLPFSGLPRRLNQLAENHHKALTRLLDHIRTPRTAAECFPPLFKREIDEGIYGLALGEAVAHLMHLWHGGQATRSRRADGAWLWQAI